jgi:hypothetical protein
MARGIYSTNIVPNYMNPPEKVYAEAMVELLAQSMDILSFPGTGTRSATSELLTKLPSRTTDFSQPRPAKSIHRHSGSFNANHTQHSQQPKTLKMLLDNEDIE